MAQKYGVLLTPIGKQKLAAAAATGTLVNIKYMVLGDGAGSEYMPSEGQAELKNIVYEMQVNAVSVDKTNPNWIVVEGYIPETSGGFTVREVGVRDDTHITLAIGSAPSMYKPVMTEGAATGTYIKVVMPVENASVINLTIDPSIVLATRKYVDDHTANTNVHGATYTATPSRLAIRNPDGRTQVADGKEPLDAVNREQLDQVISLIGSVSDSGVPLAYKGFGNGVATEFILIGLASADPATILVQLDGVSQEWGTDYTIALTPESRVIFADPPAAGVRVNIRTMVKLSQWPVNDTLIYDNLNRLGVNGVLAPTPNTIPLRGPGGELKATGLQNAAGTAIDYRGAFPSSIYVDFAANPPPNTETEITMPFTGWVIAMMKTNNQSTSPTFFRVQNATTLIGNGMYIPAITNSLNSILSAPATIGDKVKLTFDTSNATLISFRAYKSIGSA